MFSIQFSCRESIPANTLTIHAGSKTENVNLKKCNPKEDNKKNNYIKNRAPKKPQPPPMRKELKDVIDAEEDLEED